METLLMLVVGLILAALGWGIILKGVSGLFDTSEEGNDE